MIRIVATMMFTVWAAVCAVMMVLTAVAAPTTFMAAVFGSAAFSLAALACAGIISIFVDGRGY